MAYAECTILHNSWLIRGAVLAYVLMYQVFGGKEQELYDAAPVLVGYSSSRFPKNSGRWKFGVG